MKADDRRDELEVRARAFVVKQSGRDVHSSCQESARCERVGWTELGENEWAELTANLPPELVEDDDESRRAQEMLGEAFRVSWLARVKPCK